VGDWIVVTSVALAGTCLRLKFGAVPVANEGETKAKTNETNLMVLKDMLKTVE